MQTNKQVLLLLLSTSILAAQAKFSLFSDFQQPDFKISQFPTMVKAPTVGATTSSSSSKAATTSSSSSVKTNSTNTTANTTNTTTTNVAVTPLPYWELTMVNGSLAGQISVGSSDNLWVTVDVDSPAFVVTTLMGANLTSGAKGYNPLASSTVTQLDNFRYRDGTNN
jgi:hypothetical protein